MLSRALVDRLEHLQQVKLFRGAGHRSRLATQPIGEEQLVVARSCGEGLGGLQGA